MTNPSTYSKITNFVLGRVTAVLGVVQKLGAKPKKERALSKPHPEVSDVVNSFGEGHMRPGRGLPQQLTRMGAGYTFHVPGLGLTMADGGEPTGEKKEER